MSHPAEGPRHRRAPRGGEDGVNRKKQKDRINQESKESKMASDGDPKKEMMMDWKQNSGEVIVRLNPGQGAFNVEDVTAAFTDTDCVINFPEGSQWNCHFYEEIEGSCSKMQYKEKGNFLQLILQKKIPLNKWPSLQKKKREVVKEQSKLTKEIGKLTSAKESAKLNAAKEAGKLTTAKESAKPTAAKESAKPTVVKENVKGKVPPKSSTSDKNPNQPAGSSDPKKLKCEQKSARRGPETVEVPAGGKNQLTRRADVGSAPSSRPQIRKSSPHTAVSLRDSSPRSHRTVCANVKLPEQPKESPARPASPLRDPPNMAGDKVAPHDQEMIPLPDPQPTSPSPPPTVLQPGCSSTPTSRIEDRMALEENIASLSQPAPGDNMEVSMVTEDSMATEAAAPSNTSSTTLSGQVQECPPESPQPHGTKFSDSLLIPSTQDDLPPSDRAHQRLVVDNRTYSLEDGREEAEPYVNLTFVKNDHYEKGNDVVVVHVYVKQICKETSRVLFREQDFTLVFRTSDPSFLRLHPGCGPDPVFRWQVKLRNLIEPDLCKFNFTGSRIDISLQKKQCQRWGGLEAPSTQGAVGGAKVAMPSSPAPLDKAPPGSTQHPLTTKDEARGVDKEKPRAEEEKVVPPRTPTEHVKAEPLLPAPKPTCMVPPMTHSAVSTDSTQEEEEKRVCLPGFTGLVNLGNTCFMNSVIQSLSNTRELRDYFQDHSFESEINCNNPLGTGGRLAVSFAVLLRALWKGTHHAFQPSKLKAIVASKASQFTGYAQHDAQEFMAFLLDGLHEDLNRIQNKPYTETVDSDGRPDEEVADEAWLRHKMRNDSFVVDLFQGQYKSKLVCPVCAKVSITFDPFLYLPVPLPQKQKVLTVYYFAKEPHKKPIKFLVSISKENSNASDVLESISQSVRVKVENLRLAEVAKHRFHRMFRPPCSVDSVSQSDVLLCFEVLSPELAKERVLVLQVQQRPQVPSVSITKCSSCQKKQPSEEEKLKRCTRCYRVGYCNQACQKTHWPEHKTACRPENIGYPFLISVPESRLTYARLAQLLEGYARYSVNVFQPPFLPGRMSSSEQPPQALSTDKAESSSMASSQSGCTMTAEPQEEERMSAPLTLGTSPTHTAHTDMATGDGDAQGKICADRHSLLSTDSGFSEQSASTLREFDSGGEKETSYEKSVKPEAAVAGYQQSAELSSSHAALFFIYHIDSAGREVKLEDKGDSVLDLSDDSSLALVWKNNERTKEFVLVESKDLEFDEDPSSASEAARVGLFTLEQCLNLFTKPEVLAPEEAWYCPKCNQHREASKQLMLWRLPNILIIQLKRFSFRTFIWRDKINDLVDFPVRGLDLTTFCIGQKEDHQRPIYDLYAVINHYGGMIGGHYTAYARLPNDKNSQRSDVGWRLFDDSTVTSVDESQVVTRYAYVLFYRRRNSPVERPVRGHPANRRADTGASADGAASQGVSGLPFGPSSEDSSQVGAGAVSDLYAHSGEAAPSYSNMEDVD